MVRLKKTKATSQGETKVAVVKSDAASINPTTGSRANPIRLQSVRRGMLHFPPKIFGRSQK